MHSRTALPAVALATLLALAGCTGGGDGGSAPTTSAASTSDTMSAQPSAPPLPAVYTAVCEDSSGISYGVPGVGGSGQPATCLFAEAFDGDLSAFQGAIVEAVWTPGATMTGAQLLIQSDSCWQGTRLGAAGPESNACDQGNAQATTSPLRVEVSQADLATYGTDNLTAMVLSHGATTSQPFTIYVTLFQAVPPPGFTAVPA